MKTTKETDKSKNKETKSSTKSPKTLFNKGKEVAGEILTVVAKGAAAGALEAIADAVGVVKEDSKLAEPQKAPAKSKASEPTAKTKSKATEPAAKSDKAPKSTKSKK